MRLCLAHGTWQLITLIAALEEIKQREGRSPPTHLLLIEGDNVPDLRKGMETLAALLWDWASLSWAHDKLPLKPPDQWPVDVKRLTADIRCALGCRELTEIWLNQYTDFPQKLLLEAYPRADVIVYEEGLMTYTPHHTLPSLPSRIAKLGWRAIPLMLRGKLHDHMASERLCNWRLDRTFLSRIRNVFSFLSPPLKLAYPFTKCPVRRISSETMQAVLKRTIPWLKKQITSECDHSQGTILVLGAGYHLRYGIDIFEESSIYADMIQRFLDDGWTVRWKGHPRDRNDHLLAVLREKLGADSMTPVPVPSYVPVEVLCTIQRYPIAVGISSTSLFYLPRLFDTKTYTFIKNVPQSWHRGGDAFVAALAMKHIPDVGALLR